MKRKVLWITETAVMLALLITLQWLTKPLGQIVTGSCVNAVLAVAAIYAGFGSGLTIALISPIFAYLLVIAPNLVTVPVIMLGNAAYVALLCLICNGKQFWRSVVALLSGALCKFGLMYLLVTYGICGLLAQPLMDQGLLKAPMLNMLPTTFAAPQLITALVGGAAALLIAPVLKKALHRT